MKKLLIMLSVVVTAVCANAAAFTWGGAICAEDGVSEPTAFIGKTAYLLFSDAAFSSAAEYNTATGQLDGKGTVVDSYTITAADASAYVFEKKYDADYSAMNGYYAMVLVNGTDMYYNTFQVTEFTSPTTPLQDKKINPDWGGSDYIGNTAKKGTATGVPEPTSGLLLLVGGALVALRRKQK